MKLYDSFHVFVLACAVVFIVASALFDQITHPHGIARPACEWRGGAWTVVGHKGRRTLHACQYRVTREIHEAP